MNAPQKPLLYLVQAERRIKAIEPRNFKADPWLEGEGPRFWTVERVAKLKADNEALRKDRQARKRK
jgi:hypothetical protein